MTSEAPDVVVIGGGVIGSTIALRLAQENLRVTVLDQSEPGREASGAGILSPQAESNDPTPFFQLAHASRALYPSFADELRETTGVDVELRLDGVVAVAETEAEDEELAARFQWQSEAGLAVEKLSAERLMELEPSLRPGLCGGIFFPNDGQVVGPRVTEAVIRAAASAGVRFESANPARRILHENGRVTGVEAANGVVACAEVVNAAGGVVGFRFDAAVRDSDSSGPWRHRGAQGSAGTAACRLLTRALYRAPAGRPYSIGSDDGVRRLR